MTALAFDSKHSHRKTMRVTAKICGIRDEEALDAAAAGGASHVGLVFFPPSPRNLAVDQAAALANRAAGRMRLVGLFVDPAPDLVGAVASAVRLDAIQLHGHEPPELARALKSALGLEVWKAIPVKTRRDLDTATRYAGAVDRLLYDARPPEGAAQPGGTGHRFDWSLLDGFDHPLPWALAGGLGPSNVKDAVARTGARMVDVSSGVESAPGVKDVDKIAAFLKATRDL